MNDWQLELRNLVTDADFLRQKISLLPAEEEFFASNEAGFALPLRITPHYLELIRNDSTGALRRMAIPRGMECSSLPYETPDPLAEEPHEKTGRLIHRYPDRVLLLTTDVCALYCRHCFRRRFTAVGGGGISAAELESIRHYLADHPEVHEVILSGGDPLMLSDGRLAEILSAVTGIGRPMVVRISSRMPVVLPSRFNQSLIETLGRFRSLWLVVQINHPAEISPEFRRAMAAAAGVGIPVISQTVLLKGVNNSVPVLRELFYGLIEEGIKPYYLFQGDLASGTSHFRVSLARGLELYRELKKQISGLALPVYAVDLPQGGGKVHLNENSIVEERDGQYLLKDAQGKTYAYPVET